MEKTSWKMYVLNLILQKKDERVWTKFISFKRGTDGKLWQ
jgi:hypothetical protein